MKKAAARVLRFGIVGAALTALSYVIFIGGIRLGLHYLVASTVGWAVGVVLSYFANKRYTFLLEGRFVWPEFVMLVAGYVLQLVLASLGYFVLIGQLGLEPAPAFAINLIFVAAFSFAFMQFAVFRGVQPLRNSSDNPGSRRGISPARVRTPRGKGSGAPRAKSAKRSGRP